MDADMKDDVAASKWVKFKLSLFAYSPFTYLLMKKQSPFYIRPIFLINPSSLQPTSRYKEAHI
jgi:hypothetical protein